MCGSCAAAPTCATTPTAIATGSRPAPPPPPRTPAATRASAWPQTREARRLTADAAGPQGTGDAAGPQDTADAAGPQGTGDAAGPQGDRKSTRLNSSHVAISYAVFCLEENETSSQVRQ